MTKSATPKKDQRPSESAAWTAAPLSFENALRHVQWAERMAADKEWGFATAHLVLAIEEASKSAILTLYGLGAVPIVQRILDSLPKWFSNFGFKPIDLSELVRQTFQKHQVKHVTASVLLMIFWIIPRLMDKQSSETGIHFLGRMMREILGPLRNPQSLKSMVEWIRTADDLKKKGFYVDVLADRTVGPQSINEHDYAQGSIVAKAMIAELNRFKARWEELGYVRNQFIEELKPYEPMIGSVSKEEIEARFDEGQLIKLLEELEEQQKTESQSS